MAEYEIARLDENGVITSVETVSEADCRTDPVARTVRLDGNHDMRNRINGYRWNFNRHQFEALSQEPLDVAERDTSELVEGLVEVVEDLVEHSMAADEHAKNPAKARKEFKLSRRMERVMKEYRRHRPRKDKAPAT